MRDILKIARGLGDESRLRALHALQEGELCLCQIVEVLELSPATVSRHMNLLYDAGLVERRKDGRWHYYRPAEGPAAAAAALDWIRSGLDGSPDLREDARRLRRVRRRDREEAAACYRS